LPGGVDDRWAAHAVAAARQAKDSRTSWPKDRLFDRWLAGWYLIDFARSRDTNAYVSADCYLIVGWRPGAAVDWLV
jgi:hypothetical protein